MPFQEQQAGASGASQCQVLTALRGQQVFGRAAVVAAQPVRLAARQPAGQAHAQAAGAQPALQQAAHAAQAAGHACR